MDSLVKFTKQYKASLIIAIAIIMFILFGFCSAVDVAGKAKVCGLKILFEGDGLGFSRFLSALILLAPMLVVLDERLQQLNSEDEPHTRILLLRHLHRPLPHLCPRAALGV